MSSLSKGIEKVEVTLRWDPSPPGEPDHDLDIIAATYSADDPYGRPQYLVHFDSRSPDGTITLHRDSRDGKGFGSDEVMSLELDRLSATYSRVVVGVAIQQAGGRRTFAEIVNPGIRILEGYTELAVDEFAGVAGATAATIGEFTRNGPESWGFHSLVRGFDADPDTFTRVMGSNPR
ncbi:TerD family protein [Streptomyces sp. N2-109]|uniref:TerD family protein n=1 Tax=Streptomyces gossypii TaxID=2883101 RepID=A0ABT2JRV0_9ACTN|nr:TerD family protein [Streptomyces gossypii]MCT2590603.1 TerD family protein [Streptomyces gossypii]